MLACMERIINTKPEARQAITLGRFLGLAQIAREQAAGKPGWQGLKPEWLVELFVEVADKYAEAEAADRETR